MWPIVICGILVFSRYEAVLDKLIIVLTKGPPSAKVEDRTLGTRLVKGVSNPINFQCILHHWLSVFMSVIDFLTCIYLSFTQKRNRGFGRAKCSWFLSRNSFYANNGFEDDEETMTLFMNTFSFALHPVLQCNLTGLRNKLGQKLQNYPKLPHMYIGLHCNTNEDIFHGKSYLILLFYSPTYLPTESANVCHICILIYHSFRFLSAVICSFEKHRAKKYSSGFCFAVSARRCRVYTCCLKKKHSVTLR